LSFYVPPFQHASQINPTAITARPIIINHPVIGSNNTINIPIPSPIKHTPNVFFKNPFINLPPTLLLLLYVFCRLLFPFDKFNSYLYNVLKFPKKELVLNREKSKNPQKEPAPKEGKTTPIYPERIFKL